MSFRIYKAQADGKLHFIEAVQTLDDAKMLVGELGEIWHGQYVIENTETGERVFLSVRNETKN